MKLWHVQTENLNELIEVGSITLLVGHEPIWFDVISSINQYFNVRSSNTFLLEDTTPISKNDWDCYLVSYRIDLNFKKVTAKSPLNSVINKLADQINQSPFFYELIDIWEALQEEFELMNKQIREFELEAKLDDFTIDNLQKKIVLQNVGETFSPINDKQTMLKLIENEGISKRKLVLIEFPELYANEIELKKLLYTVKQMEQKGFIFVIVTSNILFQGRKNYIVNHRIINESNILSLERKFAVEVPFGYEQWMFTVAKREFLKLVDNYVFYHKIPIVEKELEQSVQVLLIMLAKFYNIRMNVDLTDFPKNIQNFLNSYLN